MKIMRMQGKKESKGAMRRQMQRGLKEGSGGK